MRYSLGGNKLRQSMFPLILLQTTEVAPPPTFALIALTGGLIGIYAARRRYGKESFRELPAAPLMIGAGLGTMLLTSYLLVAALRNQSGDNIGGAIGEWIGRGLGGALFFGGAAALLARFRRTSAKDGAIAPTQWGEAVTTPSEELPVQVTIDEAVWKVKRQSGVNAGARALSGDYDIPSQGAGLWFHPDKGKSLFLPLDMAVLPSEADLSRMTVAQLADMLQRANPIRS